MFSIICDIVTCFINQKKYFQVAKATKKPVSLGGGEGDLITGQLYPYCQRGNCETGSNFLHGFRCKNISRQFGQK